MATDALSNGLLAGKVVALTGGARGIGHETVKLLAAAGAKVGVGDLDLALVEQSLSDVGGETAGFGLDVTDRRSFEGFLDDVEARLGPIDVLINNAGVMSLNSFTDEPDATVEQMLKVNLIGPMHGMKIMIPRMLGRGRGHIINLVSSAGRFSLPGAVMYSASKFGALGLTEGAASEYSRTPLHFSAICPAIVDTDLTRGVGGKTRGARTLKPEEVAQAILNTIEKPKLLVYVPSQVGLIYLATLMLPMRARRAIERFTGADTVLTRVDADHRRAYDERAFGRDAGERQ